jgi:hypothetical protein
LGEDPSAMFVLTKRLDDRSAVVARRNQALVDPCYGMTFVNRRSLAAPSWL